MAARPKVDGAKIATLRTAKRIDQTELAGRLRRNHSLGATQATVSRWENGQEPRAYVLPALAAELGCSIEDLYANDDEEEAASMPLHREPVTPEDFEAFRRVVTGLGIRVQLVQPADAAEVEA